MQQWWQSWGRLAAVIAVSVVGALLLFLAFCFWTSPGHRVVAWLAGSLTGGEVRITGLSGNLPDHLRARELELRDVAGTWLRAEDVRLDWHAFAALGDHVTVEKLSAARVQVLRRKISSATTSPSNTIVAVGSLSLPRIELDQPVLGRRAVLSGTGSLHYTSRHDVAADLAIRRLDGPGRYDVHAAIVHDVVRGTITIFENGVGLAGGAIGMPDLGAVTLELRAGAQGNSNTVTFKAQANLLDVFGAGSIDLAANRGDLAFSVVSPAMHPSADLSWTLLSARGHLRGTFKRPDVSADVHIKDLETSGNRIADVTGTVRGAGGAADLRLILAGLHLEKEKAPLFAAVPVELTAHADLQAPGRPVVFAIRHPLLNVKGRSTLQTPVAAHVEVSLPALERLAPLTGVALAGNGTLNVDFRQASSGAALQAKGRIATRGKSALARLLGNAQLAMNMSIVDAQNLSLDASLKGARANAKFGGGVHSGKQDFSGEIAISDLSAVLATLTGNLVLRERLTGPQGNGVLAVDGTANAATKGMAKQSIDITARAKGLPNLKTASLHLSGRFDSAPVSVSADVEAAGQGTMKITLNEASWRSARALGNIVVQGTAPRGSIGLKIARLADFAPLAGSALEGSLDAHTDFQATSATIHATGEQIVSGATNLGHVEVNGTVTDPLGSPSLALTVALPQFATSGVGGSAEGKLNGPLNALKLSLNSDLTASNGQQFSVAMQALADTVAKHVTVSRFDTDWRDQSIRLARPATIDYADGLKFSATFADAKSAQISAEGTIPADPGKSMNVHLTGTADIGVLGAGLASVGQTVRGKLAINTTITGTTTKPNATGNVTLTGGQLQDYARGINLTNVEATAEAQGQTIRLTKFAALAGQGTISGSGTVDLAGKGMPVDITFAGKNARPIVSDLVTAHLDTDLKLQGHLADTLTLSGTLRIRDANINIPEKYSTDVASLNVRRKHQPPLPPPHAGTQIALDLNIVSGGQIFVRGRGLEAEFEGELKIAGTDNAPQVQGALTLRRGTFNLAGTNLVFQSGTISFNGQALRRKLDPSLDLTAQSEANGITATLKVTGTASQPRIELSSSPPMPQDEILSELLFQQSAKSLSAMQLASLASAAASLGGGSGFDPVGSVRKSLGLDRLAVGSLPSANGGSGTTTVEAGKYVMRNVYLAARQDLSGGTRALVQVDITKHLKAQAQVNTGPRAAATTSTPLQDNGDSIGLSYQFDY